MLTCKQYVNECCFLTAQSAKSLDRDKQIGAESRETAAWCFVFPTEAGREGILLVSCAPAALERVHASAAYFSFPA